MNTVIFTLSVSLIKQLFVPSMYRMTDVYMHGYDLTQLVLSGTVSITEKENEIQCKYEVKTLCLCTLN